MNNAARSFLLSLAFGLSSSAMASHLPSITVTIDGNAAKYVAPQLVSTSSANTIDFFVNDGVYLAEGVAAGAYTLTLVDEDKGDVLLVDQLTLTSTGSHHLKGGNRHVTCSFTNGEIVCLNHI